MPSRNDSVLIECYNACIEALNTCMKRGKTPATSQYLSDTAN